MGQISFQYSPWYLLLFFLISLGIALMVYSKNKAFSDRTPIQKLLLGALRTLGLFLLFFLLLHPILKRFTEYATKPALVIAQDGSLSIPLKAKNDLNLYLTKRDELIKSLEEDYSIHILDLGNKIYPSPRDSFDGKSTDLNALLEYCTDYLDLRNVKAILLASDGIYNTGKNPLYNSIIKQLPVYTILLGDTTQSKDLSISNIFHNEVIHAGDDFVAQIDVKAYNCSSSVAQIQLKEFKNNSWQLLNTQNITISENNHFQTLDYTLSTTAPGVYRYKIESAVLPDESNAINNVREFYVQVLESKTKVLILANSPHPDIAAIKAALQSNKNYLTEISYSSNPSQKLDDIKAVILHQLPSIQISANNLNGLLKNRTIPQVFILGEATQLNEFNKIQDNISLQSSSKGINEVVPILNKEFFSFTLSSTIQQNLEKFAPLNAPFGNYETKPNVNILCYQKIGRVETAYPLWAVSDKNGLRQAYIFGDGIWKWRLNEFNSTNATEAVDELLTKTIQYVTTKSDDRRLRIKPDKNIFGSGESISFKAEFYNDNLSRINESDLHLNISDMSGNQYPFVFSKELDFYTLNCGSFQPGDYKYSGKIIWNHKEYKQEGRLAISSFDIETVNTTADHALLRNISSRSGGSAYYPSEMERFSSDLKASGLHKPTLYFNLEFRPFIDSKWLFILAFLFLATEWFLRRYWGSY